METDSLTKRSLETSWEAASMTNFGVRYLKSAMLIETERYSSHYYIFFIKKEKVVFFLNWLGIQFSDFNRFLDFGSPIPETNAFSQIPPTHYFLN